MSHVFLSYRGDDRPDVLAVRERLQTRGIATFLDRDNLTPGLLWPEALERALDETGAVAVFVGPHGLGAWQKREMYFALDQQAQAKQPFPVIPVLLPGADPRTRFLFLNTWINLRQDVRATDGIDQLERAIRGDAATRAEGVSRGSRLPPR